MPMWIQKTWRHAKRYVAELVSAVLGVTIVVVGIVGYRRLPATASMEDRLLFIQCVVFSLGLVSVVLLVLELRQKASWNRVLSYHDYFGELPARGKVADLYACFDRLGIAKAPGAGGTGRWRAPGGGVGVLPILTWDLCTLTFGR